MIKPSKQYSPLFQNRAAAGDALVPMLREFANRPAVVVLGLPRGGVPVAAVVARALHAPLDIFLVRKLGVPEQNELAMGAIASGGVRVLNREVVQKLGISEQAIQAVTERERQELQRRERSYRAGRAALQLAGRTVIAVDDGLATGATMRAAIAALRDHNPAAVIVAVPIAAAEICEQLDEQVDRVICVATPHPFIGVGYWYADFSQTTDAEVHSLLKAAAEPSQLTQTC